ncbi:hypothetical protein [Botrimarina mediterranea]|uniref:hypothetical protein n=1 Tax=Botrimarina mediterranea TaxID=2528022 RepID=UPI0018D2E4DF|nr:hypothetical protein [Botrimarina mediterranea]
MKAVQPLLAAVTTPLNSRSSLAAVRGRFVEEISPIITYFASSKGAAVLASALPAERLLDRRNR